jgi:hypothetical protein
MAQIGFTRRDKTPYYWQKDYRLTPAAKKLIQALHAEHERLFREFEALPIEMSDEDYHAAEVALTVQLDAIIAKEDAIRRENRR